MAADAQAPVPYWQHLQLVEEVRRVKAKSDSNATKVAELEKTGAGDSVEFREMRLDIQRVEGKVDRMIWAIVGLALTIAGSMVGLALALGAHP